MPFNGIGPHAGTYVSFPVTMDQEITLFEVLDIPFSAKGYTVSTDNFGTTRTALSVNPAAIILQDIEDYLGANIPPVNDANWILRLTNYLARWNVLGTTTIKMNQGNVGDMTGVTKEPDAERELIRERVRQMVPFYVRYAWLMKMEGTGGAMVPVMR